MQMHTTFYVGIPHNENSIFKNAEAYSFDTKKP